MIEIRPATPGDAVAISRVVEDTQAIHAAAHPDVFKPATADCFPPDAIRSLMGSPDHLFFVAVDAGDVVGYSYAEIQRRPESGFKFAALQMYVHQMGVRDAHRGRGIGSGLLSAVRDSARARGITHLALDVWTFNERARQFYVDHGFQPYQERLWIDTRRVASEE
jgi:GNAT superfamily N-acetyltransferase